MKFSVAIFLVFTTTTLSAQLDSSSFDFWVGDWELSWVNPTGDTVNGSNRIQPILNGRVIQENFADPSSGYEGKSWSTFSPITGTWKQVWVDNSSGYLEFDGAQYGDTLSFVTQPILQNGKEVIKRMIFYNIGNTRFTWDWQSKEVGQTTWNLLWRIHYTRASK